MYAFAHVPQVCNRLNLFWGIRPINSETAVSVEQMVQTAEQELLRLRKVNPGNVVGVVAGTQQTSGSTNFMRFHVVTEPPPPERRKERRKPPFAARKKK